jgi:preprotein translocase subunit SecD
MLYFSRWKATAILLTTLIVCALAVPNFFPEKTVQSWPKWAQRHLVLGLDLQGGSHILLEVDTNAVRKEKLDTLRDDVRRVVRENRLGSPGAAVIRGNSVEFRIREGVDPQLALQKLRELSTPLGGVLSATGQRSLEVVDAWNVVTRLTPTLPALVERLRQSVEQWIQILERRVN